jgi:hypothetical protein
MDEIFPNQIQLFKSVFKGREDVFAVRWEKEFVTKADKHFWKQTLKVFQKYYMTIQTKRKGLLFGKIY